MLVDWPWENWENPVLCLFSKYVSYISFKAKGEAIFVWTICKSRSSESLWKKKKIIYYFYLISDEYLRKDQEDKSKHWFMFTYSGSVLPHKPHMIAIKRHYANEEEGRHKKQKQYVEFGVCVRKLFLKQERTKGKRCGETSLVQLFSLVMFLNSWHFPNIFNRNITTHSNHKRTAHQIDKQLVVQKWIAKRVF